MSLNHRHLYFLFPLFTSLCAVSQQRTTRTPLDEVLRQVEKRFAVTFTYIDRNVEGIIIQPPSQQLNLVETLFYLERQTGLQLEQLNDRFITIEKKPVGVISVCGVVVDASTQDPVTGASINVNDAYTITDEDGYFHLTSIPGDSIVAIHALGYEPADFLAKTFSASPCLHVSLDPRVTTLPEITITDYLTEGISKRVDGSFQIKPSKLGILPGLIEPDVLQTIQSLPGIQSVDETISNMSIRGGTNDQNLILWDGIKMYQSGHFFGLISAFNPYLTDRITLIKNGTSAYLSDGVSSTIDIRSVDTLPQKVTGGLGINMINADFFIRVPISSKISAQISSRRSISDLVKTPTYNQYFKRIFNETDVYGDQVVGTDTVVTSNREFYFYDVNVKVLYDISASDRLRFNFLHLKNAVSYRENSRGNSTIESRESNLIQQSTAMGLSYEKTWGDRVRSTLDIYQSQYQLDATNYDIFNDQRLVQQNAVQDFGAKAGVRYLLTPTIDLLGGYQFFEIAIRNVDEINNPPFSRLVKRVLHNHVAFVEANFTSPSNATSFRAGIRINHMPKFDKTIVEPRVSFNQKLGHDFSLEVLGEKKSQATTQVIDVQRDFLGVEKRRWILTDNDNFPILQSTQLSTGIHYNPSNLLVGVDVYYKNVNGITSMSQGFRNQFQLVQAIGSYNAAGVDFLINKKIRKVNTWVSYSYAHNEFSFSSLTPPTFPNNLDIKHSVSLAFSFTDEHLQMATGLKWHTGKPYTMPLDRSSGAVGDIEYDEPNSARLENYLRVDFSIKYAFLISPHVRAHVGVSLWNLLNKINIIDQYYTLNNTNEVQEFQQPALGITPNAMFRIEF